MTGAWHLFRRYLGRQAVSVSTMALFLCLATGLTVLGPLIMGRFVDRLTAHGSAQELARLAYLYLVVAGVAGGVRIVAGYLTEAVAWRATNALREDLTAHLLRLPLGFFYHRSAGEMVERVDGDITALFGFLSGLAFKLGASVLLILGTLLALAWLSWPIMASLLVLTIALGLVLTVIRRQSGPLFQAEREENARAYGAIGEVLSARRDLQALGREQYGERRVWERLRTWAPRYIAAERRGYLLWCLILAVFGLETGLSYALGARFYLLGSLPLGSVFAVVAYTGMLARPFEAIRDQLEEWQRGDASAVRIEALLHESEERRPATLQAGRELSLELTDVTFSYHERPVLTSVTARLAAGERVAVMGRTGSGKTSLGRLAAGLYSPSRGVVRVAGMAPSGLGASALSGAIAYLPQEPFFFSGSIRDNVTGFLDSGGDDRIAGVMDDLGLSEWIRGREGLDTRLEAGALSLGERALLHVARILIRDPGLVILDEPTAALDPVREHHVLEVLDRWLRGRTAVIITHRPALLTMVDIGWRLVDGRLVAGAPEAASEEGAS